METAATEGECRERAISISTQRILTKHDFQQLKIVEMKKPIQDQWRNRLEESTSNSKKFRFKSWKYKRKIRSEVSYDK